MRKGVGLLFIGFLLMLILFLSSVDAGDCHDPDGGKKRFYPSTATFDPSLSGKYSRSDTCINYISDGVWKVKEYYCDWVFLLGDRLKSVELKCVNGCTTVNGVGACKPEIDCSEVKDPCTANQKGNKKCSANRENYLTCEQETTTGCYRWFARSCVPTPQVGNQEDWDEKCYGGNCVPAVEICDNGVNDDWDSIGFDNNYLSYSQGLIDCKDPDCNGKTCVNSGTCISGACIGGVTTIACKLTSLGWFSDGAVVSSAEKGTSLNLAVVGTNCANKMVSFDITAKKEGVWKSIREWISFSNPQELAHIKGPKDARMGLYLVGTLSSSASSTWRVLEGKDVDEGSNYYVRANVYSFDRSLVSSIKSGPLKIIGETSCTRDCGDGVKEDDTECLGTDGFKTCLKDTAGCLGWSPKTNCQSGKTCSGGVCSDPNCVPTDFRDSTFCDSHDDVRYKDDCGDPADLKDSCPTSAGANGKCEMKDGKGVCVYDNVGKPTCTTNLQEDCVCNDGTTLPKNNLYKIQHYQYCKPNTKDVYWVDSCNQRSTDLADCSTTCNADGTCGGAINYCSEDTEGETCVCPASDGSMKDKTVNNYEWKKYNECFDEDIWRIDTCWQKIEKVDECGSQGCDYYVNKRDCLDETICTDYDKGHYPNWFEATKIGLPPASEDISTGYFWNWLRVNGYHGCDQEDGYWGDVLREDQRDLCNDYNTDPSSTIPSKGILLDCGDSPCLDVQCPTTCATGCEKDSYGCLTEICLDPTKICTETDSGKDKFNAGETTDNFGEYPDVCYSTNKLTEYYCDSGVHKSELITCANGCEMEDGLGFCNNTLGDDCVDDDDCASDELCLDDACVECEDDNDCSGDDLCTDEGLCVECEDDNDCETGKECNNDHECITSQGGGGGGEVSTCTETDGGYDYYNAGTVLANSASYPDVCASLSSVKEYVCLNGKVEHKIWECVNGCDDGACLRASQSEDDEILPVRPDSTDEQGTGKTTIVWAFIVFILLVLISIFLLLIFNKIKKKKTTRKIQTRAYPQAKPTNYYRRP